MSGRRVSRYLRQISVPGVGERGQEAIRRAVVRVEGSDLAAEVCALYLAGAGVGALEVDPALADACRALNHEVAVTAQRPPCENPERTASALIVVVGEPTLRWTIDDRDVGGDPVLRGSTAARWALARILDRDVRAGHVRAGGSAP